MARRRRVRYATPDGVPVELTDPDHPTWLDADRIEHLAAELGIDYSEPPHSAIREAEWSRFKAFRRAYCERNGLMSQTWPGTIDWQAVEAAGIYRHSHAAARVHKLLETR